jgi:hypothetical protein
VEGMTIHLQGSKKARDKCERFFCQTSAVRAAERGGNLSTGEKVGSGCNLLDLQRLFRFFAGLRRERKCPGLELGDLGQRERRRG